MFCKLFVTIKYVRAEELTKVKELLKLLQKTETKQNLYVQLELKGHVRIALIRCDSLSHDPLWQGRGLPSIDTTPLVFIKAFFML